jgi:hypothetical protein
MNKNTIITTAMWAVVKKYNIPKEDVITKSNQCFYNPAKDWKPATVVFSIKWYIRFTIFINDKDVKLKASKVEKLPDGTYAYHTIDDDKIQEAIDNRPLWWWGVVLEWLESLLPKNIEL